MNRIVVSNNKVDGIYNNIVNLNESGIYEIVYRDSNDIKIEFNISDSDIIIYESMFDEKINVNNTYNINNGSLKINKFYANKEVNEIINVNLLGEGDKFNYNFSNICNGIEKYIININHNNKKTISNVKNKSIAIKNGDIDFIINSSVKKDCIKSMLDQNTRIVTLDNSKAKVSPNMFIDLDDVVAKHGSVIGVFNEEQIFYLMSKGISYYDSVKLLVKGYLLSNVDVTMETRIKIMEIIDKYWR